MPGTREIRRRIKSVKNIGQITKAMELVAASKMRRAQEAATAGRRYRQTIDQILRQVQPAGDESVNPLLALPEQAETKPALVVVFGPDKGLCGGLVTNLLRELAVYNRDHDDTVFVTMGKKSRDGLIRLKADVQADFPLHDRPRLGMVLPLATLVLNEYASGKYGRVLLAYTDFVNVLQQKPVIQQLLPLTVPEASAEEATVSTEEQFLFEPNKQAVLDQLLPRYLEMSMFQALLEAQASEHSARMMAMKNAGDNARDIQDELTLTYNQLRQASITAELAEIASATAG